MLQVEYPNNFILDVGWYGEEGNPMSEAELNNLTQSSFVVYIIKNLDWETPVKRYCAKSLSELKTVIQRAVNDLSLLIQ